MKTPQDDRSSGRRVIEGVLTAIAIGLLHKAVSYVERKLKERRDKRNVNSDPCDKEPVP